MRKNMMKLTALVLVLALALSLSACGSDQEKLIGTWRSDVEFAPVFNETLGSGEDAAYLTVESLKIRMILTFTEEGTYTLTADAGSVETAMASLKDSLKAGMERYLEETVAESGLDLTAEEILTLMGTTMDELIDAAVSQEMIDEMAGSMAAAGRFKAEDGKLYLSESPEQEIDVNVYETYIYEKENDKLILVTPNTTDAYTDLLYPLEFTRAAQ